jgi:hypothetical protein
MMTATTKGNIMKRTPATIKHAIEIAQARLNTKQALALAAAEECHTATRLSKAAAVEVQEAAQVAALRGMTMTCECKLNKVAKGSRDMAERSLKARRAEVRRLETKLAIAKQDEASASHLMQVWLEED